MNNTHECNKEVQSQENAIIKIIGVGGGGCNAVDFMCRKGIKGASFALCHSYPDLFEDTSVSEQILLGRGLDAHFPRHFQKYAEDKESEFRSMLGDGTRMVIIVAGMGGGIGSGAAPVVARIAKEMDIFTVGVVTTPFRFEGLKKKDIASEAIEEMTKNVDSLFVFDNERLKDIHPDYTLYNAFKKADETLYEMVKSITEIITVHGLIHLDFYDVSSLLKDGSMASIGIGYGEGDHAVGKAIENAIHSPLLNGKDVFKSVKHLMYVTFSEEDAFKAEDMHDIADYHEKFESDCNMKWGLSYVPDLGCSIKVTIIAIPGFS